MNKIFFASMIILAAMLLSGCVNQGSSLEKNEKNREQEKAQNADYVSRMLNSNQNKEITEQTADVSNTNAASADNILSQYDKAVIETNFGKITVKFYSNDAPLTVSNFMKLASQKFYDGTKFHRVIKGFMIQGGDPNSKDGNPNDDGMGGPGYSFKDEINSHKLVRGSLAMANSGPNTNGSQFFIVTAESTPWLDGKHTNFGEVVEGMEVVDKIENVSVNNPQINRPVQDVIIKSVALSEVQQ